MSELSEKVHDGKSQHQMPYYHPADAIHQVNEPGVVQVSSYASSDDAPILTKVEERKLLARIDLHVMPPICIIFMLAFLDRYIHDK